MVFQKTHINNCFIIEPRIFSDNRGYFFEAFNKEVFKKNTGIEVDFIQDNQSKSTKNVVRGLHIQRPPFSQAKLVRVLEGEVLDVVVDVRKDSNTFGKTFTILLSSENQKQLFVPRGCLHGFSVLSETAVFFYKCDNLYNKSSEDSINPFDDFLGINWNVSISDALLSEKDKGSKSFNNFEPIEF